MTLNEVRLDITLAELAATMDDALGRDTGMAAVLEQWVITSDIASHLKSGSEYLRPYAATLGIEDAYLPRTPFVVDPRLRSDYIREHDPEGWLAVFKGPVVFARLGGPRTRHLPTPFVTDAKNRPNHGNMVDQLCRMRADCRKSNRLRRDALVELMDEAGWDETTRVTSDGYRIGRDTVYRINVRNYLAYRELYPRSEDRPPALRD